MQATPGWAVSKQKPSHTEYFNAVQFDEDYIWWVEVFHIFLLNLKIYSTISPFIMKIIKQSRGRLDFVSI